MEREVVIDRAAGQQVWNEWTRLWNGEYELATKIVGPRFDLFLTAAVPDDATAINNDETVEAWIRSVREKFTTIRYITVAGPYFDTEAQVISCGWEAKGVFAGKTGLPEDHPGKTFHLTGTDILQLSNGKISGCRTMSNPARPQ